MHYNYTKRITCLLLVLFIISCAKADDKGTAKSEELPEVLVTAGVDRADAEIGDTILYSIEISSIEGIKVNLPQIEKDITGFKVLDHGEAEPKEVDDRIVLKRWCKLQADSVGSYIIPAVNVTYQNKAGEEVELSTEEIYVQVRSVLAEGEEFDDIIDIKPLVDVKTGHSTLIVVLAGTVILLAALAALILYIIRREKDAFMRIVPAHEIAYRELDELKGSSLLSDSSVKLFHFRLSEVFRRYLELRYSINASEWTTEEIIPVVEKKLSLDAVLKGHVKTLLTATDRVKFTDFIPDKSESFLEFSRAYKFVDQTKEELEAPENPSSDGS